MAETGYARPVADLASNNTTPVGAATRWEATDEVTLSTGDYVSMPNYSSFSVQFGGFTPPAGSTIDRVRLVLNKGSSYPGAAKLGRVSPAAWGGDIISWGYNTGTAYHYSAWMTTNPFTSAPWTVDDIANTKAEYTRGAGGLNLHQTYLEIEYTLGARKRNQAIVVI